MELIITKQCNRNRIKETNNTNSVKDTQIIIYDHHLLHTINQTNNRTEQ